MTTGYQWAKKTKTRQLRDEISRPRKNKFNAVKVKLDGHVFDSKAEAKRYGELKLLEKAGKICSIIVHHRFELKVRRRLVATYEADFWYYDRENHRWRIEDVKSPPTAKLEAFKIKRELMRAIYGMEVEIISSGSRSITAADPFGLEAA